MKTYKSTPTRPEGVKIGKISGSLWVRWRAPYETDQEFLEATIQMTKSFLKSKLQLKRSKK